MFRKTWLLCLLLLPLSRLTAQPFKKDIDQFRKEDSAHPPPQHAILFVGSSSFTKWTDVQKYFPEFKIINRGFGGSTLNDLIFYAPQVIYPYKPKQVVIYCGDNDLAAGGIVYAASVSNRFRDLFRLIRKHLPDANITFISIKPSPSNLKLMSKADSANRAIKLFISSERNAAFVDVYHAMLGGNGRPLPSIFLSDSLHMNEKGYAIWKKEIEPYLEK